MVFSTVHTTDAIKTIGRLIAVFPPSEQKMVRMRLADNLTATISQRLLPRADAKGMVAAQEIMVNNTGIAECIANPELTGQMIDFISRSFKEDGSGGQTFDQHLALLYKRKVITLEAAMESSSNPSDFQRNLMFGSGSSGGGKGGAEGETGRVVISETVDLDRGEAAAPASSKEAPGELEVPKDSPPVRLEKAS
jgi:twitching motility protein PilT